MPTHSHLPPPDYSQPLDYSFYRLHNYHSLIYAAMMAGQSHVALEYAGRMEATISEDLLLVDSPPMATWMESFLSVRMHVLIRFCMREEIQKLSIPQNQRVILCHCCNDTLCKRSRMGCNWKCVRG
jgi:hypothetical protein